jgi:glucose-6-phosphate 1-dehydrogenase
LRAFATERLEEHAAHLPSAVREGLVKSLRYRIADVTDPVAAEAALRVAGDSEPVAVYLALPQHLYSSAIDALVRAGLPPDSRVVLEKPFGEDQQSARALNAQIQESVPGGEAGVFRVDHVLGMATTQNLLALRATDRVLDAVWSGEHIEEVSIHWEETLALEGRAGFYDHAGALKDVLQNHMLQVLALVAMEPPTSLDAYEVRARKLDALKAVQSLDVGRMSRRARYTAGRLSGTGGAAERDVPSYIDEEGVDPSRETETFAELLLELNTPRWAGTRFRMRAGKALRDRRKGVVVRFRSSHAGMDELRIGLDGPEDLMLRLHGAAPVELTSPPISSELPAYAAVLLDVLTGGSRLSVSGEEAEEAWRIVDPVLAGWCEGRVPIAEYPAGSEGPQRL